MRGTTLAALVVGLLFVALSPSADAAPPCTDEWKGRRPPDEVLVQLKTSGQGRMLCEADLSNVDLRGANLIWANLTGANLANADLTGANLRDADLSGAKLPGTNLSGARLVNTILREADLSDANLTRATLIWADATNALLIRADLRGVNLTDARLTGARLARANLSRAVVRNTDLAGAVLWHRDLGGANLCQAYFEPRTLPTAEQLARAANLWAVTAFDPPGVLWAVREEFRRAGLRTQERQMTFAMLRARFAIAWFRPDIPNEKARQEGNCPGDWMFDLPWPRHWRLDLSLDKIDDKIESLFSFLMFDLTSAYGMYPGRALRILAALIVLFSGLYLSALASNEGAGIILIMADSADPRVPALVPPHGPARLSLSLLAGKANLAVSRRRWVPAGVPAWLRALRVAVYFSLLSAFAIGWRDLNIGAWIARMQRREFILLGTGWVRTASGVQAVLSTFLLALWALTYFGRPFE